MCLRKPGLEVVWKRVKLVLAEHTRRVNSLCKLRFCSKYLQMASSRGQTWTHKEILALIRIWSDSTVQSQLDGALRTADIWGNVAGQLQAAGCNRTSKQCKDKMKNLKQYYKDLLDGHNRSGHDRSNWPYYDLIDDVLVDRPSTRP